MIKNLNTGNMISAEVCLNKMLEVVHHIIKPYKAEIFFIKPWRTNIKINALDSSFRFI